MDKNNETANTTTAQAATPETPKAAPAAAPAAPTAEEVAKAKETLKAAEAAGASKELTIGERADAWTREKVFNTTVLVNEHPKTAIAVTVASLLLAAAGGYYVGSRWGASAPAAQ